MEDNCIYDDLVCYLQPYYGSPKEALKLANMIENPNYISSSGDPLIVTVAKCGSWEVFEVLIKHENIDFMAKGRFGINAYQFAIAGMVRENWKYWSKRSIQGSKKIALYYNCHVTLQPVEKAIFYILTEQVSKLKLLANEINPTTIFPDPTLSLSPGDIVQHQKMQLAAYEIHSKSPLPNILSLKTDEQIEHFAELVSFVNISMMNIAVMKKIKKKELLLAKELMFPSILYWATKANKQKSLKYLNSLFSSGDK